MGKYNKYFLEARQKKRYTQPQLQRLSGVSSSQTSYAETGARALRFKTAVKIAWTLGLSLDDMIRSRKSEYTPKKWSVPPGGNIGEAIRNAREQRGLTLKGLAQQCGVPLNTISSIENGHSKNPIVDHMAQIAIPLHLSLDQIAETYFREKER